MENKVHVLRQLLRQRWRLANWVVLVYLAAVVITCVWITIVDGFIKEAVLGVTMGYGFFRWVRVVYPVGNRSGARLLVAVTGWHQLRTQSCTY
ncbi:hypothetical protein [Lacticaseibacillus pantheris]|uniref:hypothetical protein n=1 Tax=Lacticaseibacillus pantheris TaxID=171523 RepID=UPI0006CF5799|nr:hypothetical protein [Lacticaseibacillus pantheris]